MKGVRPNKTSSDLIVSSLCIKKIELLPSPMKKNSVLSRKATFTYSLALKNPVSRNNTISLARKPDDITGESSFKDSLLLNENVSSNLLNHSPTTLTHIDNNEEFLEKDSTSSLKLKSKKALKIRKLKVEEEEEIYQDCPIEVDNIDDKEKRINEWLDARNIVIKDPMEKKDDYYQLRKNMVIKSWHNSPIKKIDISREKNDCNSPSLNLDINSGLLLKRKLKSSTMVAELQNLSKFSQI